MIAPLVPAEVDLSDFQYMELDVRLLRDSKFAAEVEPEAFRAGVLLWCAAWHQIPAGSLPDNDVELSNLAGFGRVVKEWKKVREQALSLFVACSDGRLYHPIIAAKAVSAWESKLRHQHGKLLERLRKENKKRSEEKLDALPLPTFDQWNSDRKSPGIPPENKVTSAGIPPEKPLRGNGEGTEPNGDSYSASVPSAEVATKRATRKCPEAFEVSGALVEWAVENHPHVDRDLETAKFRDHTFKTAISDWDGAWRNWIRRCGEFGGTGRSQPAPQQVNRQEAFEARNRAVGQAWLESQGDVR